MNRIWAHGIFDDARSSKWMTLIAAAQDVHVFDACGLRVPTQSNSWNKFAIAPNRVSLRDNGSRGSRFAPGDSDCGRIA
jgi:hypothetical protein